VRNRKSGPSTSSAVRAVTTLSVEAGTNGTVGLTLRSRSPWGPVTTRTSLGPMIASIGFWLGSRAGAAFALPRGVRLVERGAGEFLVVVLERVRVVDLVVVLDFDDLLVLVFELLAASALAGASGASSNAAEVSARRRSSSRRSTGSHGPSGLPGSRSSGIGGMESLRPPRGGGAGGARSAGSGSSRNEREARVRGSRLVSGRVRVAQAAGAEASMAHRLRHRARAAHDFSRPEKPCAGWSPSRRWRSVRSR